MKIKSFLVMMTIIIFTASCGKGDTMNDLGLVLSLDKATYRQSEAINALVTLKNIGKADVIVNDRMAVNFSDAPDELRDIAFIVRGTSENVIPFSARVGVRLLKPDDFTTLTKGDSIETSYNIKELYALDTPGVYTICAIYQNTQNPDWHNTAWKGQLTSNSVTFEIVP